MFLPAAPTETRPCGASRSKTRAPWGAVALRAFAPQAPLFRCAPGKSKSKARSRARSRARMLALTRSGLQKPDQNQGRKAWIRVVLGGVIGGFIAERAAQKQPTSAARQAFVLDSRSSSPPVAVRPASCAQGWGSGRGCFAPSRCRAAHLARFACE